MSFHCAAGHTTEPNVKMVKIVSRRRDRTYPDGSVGWEIVEELPVCTEHAKQLAGVDTDNEES